MNALLGILIAFLTLAAVFSLPKRWADRSQEQRQNEEMRAHVNRQNDRLRRTTRKDFFSGFED